MRREGAGDGVRGFFLSTVDETAAFLLALGVTVSVECERRQNLQINILSMNFGRVGSAISERYLTETSPSPLFVPNLKHVWFDVQYSFA